MSHFLLMVLYASMVSLFLSVLWQRGPRARMGLFLKLFLGLVLGALAVAYLMYPFPGPPPQP